MNNAVITDKFLDLYKQLEILVKQKYCSHLKADESVINALIRKSEFADMKEELQYCARVRNLLTHYPKMDDEYLIIPSDSLINLLDKVIFKITNPVTAHKICIKREQLFIARYNDSVPHIMRNMQKRGFSHTAVLENERVAGVFSDNTIFTYICMENNPVIEPYMQIRDFGKYLDLENHSSEGFDFTAKETPLYELKNKFSRRTKNGKRLVIIFVTEHGNQKERLLGLISPWDIM